MVGVKRGCHSIEHMNSSLSSDNVTPLYFLFRVGIVVDVRRRCYS